MQEALFKITSAVGIVNHLDCKLLQSCQRHFFKKDCVVCSVESNSFLIPVFYGFRIAGDRNSFLSIYKKIA
jgi:hypothetical protein